MDVERHINNISESLLQLSYAELGTVARFMKLSEDHLARAHNRRHLLAALNRLLDELEDSEEEDALLVYLQRLTQFIESLRAGKSETVQAMESAVSPQQMQLQELKDQFIALQKTVQESAKTFEKVVRSDEFPSASKPQIPVKRTIPASEITIRKEFKINGQIGEREQKERLSYTNLIHQIDLGIQKGYQEEEIIEAVVKAISPGLHLRNMLEMKNNLTLPQLRIILKGHYKEESTSDLYHKLINISQDNKESPQNFLFRAIVLKERLLFASREEEAEERFDAGLVQKKFLRSIETGLLSGNIKFQLKQYLEDSCIPDEVLIEKMNEAASLELEREQKLKKGSASKSVKVSQSKVDIMSAQQECCSEEDPPPHPPLVTQKAMVKKKIADTNWEEVVSELRAELAEMKQCIREATKSKPVRSRGGFQNRRYPACEACQASNQGNYCCHCLQCGQEGHYARECRVPRFKQPKDRGLLGRGDQ